MTSETLSLLSEGERSIALLEGNLTPHSTSVMSYYNNSPYNSTARKASRLINLFRNNRKRNNSNSTDASLETGDAFDGLLKRKPPSEFGVSDNGSTNTEQGDPDDGLEMDAPRSYHDNNRLISRTDAYSFSQGLEAQDFSVSVTIIQGRLSGPNMDPIVSIQVGDNKRYTSEKLSTHCPYYNEYFVFDFHMASGAFYDQLILLTVYQSRKLLRPTEVFGSFKLDVATVHAQKDGGFYHKWAVLMDPEDMQSGPKGYLKCSIVVSAKGEVIKSPPKPEKENDEDNIEGNLLLPTGVSGSRCQARYQLSIHSAEGLPTFSSGVMAKAKKALTGDATPDNSQHSVNVSFAGHTGKTRWERGCGSVTWNQDLVFVEMFPPLVRRVRIQIRRNDSLGATTVATHYLDLSTISDEGRRGFIPTFGPAFINLYGSPLEGGILEGGNCLNEGRGEGVAYRGRLMISLRVEVIDGPPCMVPGVSYQPCLPIPENALGPKDEFLLFGCVMNVSMLDKRLVEKNVHLEVSIGNLGEAIRGDPDEKEMGGTDWMHLTYSKPSPVHSRTPSIKPLLRDSSGYSYLPFGDSKPCIYISFKNYDLRWRLFHANTLEKIAINLENGLRDDINVTNRLVAEKRFNALIEKLIADICQYLSQSKTSCNRTGMNKLDKEKWDRCQRELPQDSLADVLVWLMCGTKRLAYHRIPAKDLIFSPNQREKGSFCAKFHSFYLKLPGKAGNTESAWRIQGQVSGAFWLGLNSSRRGLLEGLPVGFQHTPDVIEIDRANKAPPSVLEFTVKSAFQVRCYLYQARSLLASDNTGLSDPFARVLFHGHSKTSQVIENTLNPTWDETLIIPRAIVYGASPAIQSNPPSIVLEIFDQDQIVRSVHLQVTRLVLSYKTCGRLPGSDAPAGRTSGTFLSGWTKGKEEFMGQVVALPKVNLLGEPYQRPGLEWMNVYRGLDHAGEILAAFELIQLDDTGRTGPDVPEITLSSHLAGGSAPALLDSSSNTTSIPPTMPPSALTSSSIFRSLIPVPHGIRPQLSKYRMEVLFWGLRELKRINLLPVERPRIDIEIGGFQLSSDPILSYSKNPNFATLIKSVDLDLPTNPVYWPAVTIRCVDLRSFGRDTMVGTHIIRNINSLICESKPSRSNSEIKKDYAGLDNVITAGNGDGVSLMGGDPATAIVNGGRAATIINHTASRIAGDPHKKRNKIPVRWRNNERSKDLEMDTTQLDWWSKYFASVEEMLEEERSSEAADNATKQKKDKDSAFGENNEKGSKSNGGKFGLKSSGCDYNHYSGGNPKWDNSMSGSGGGKGGGGHGGYLMGGDSTTMMDLDTDISAISGGNVHKEGKGNKANKENARKRRKKQNSMSAHITKIKVYGEELEKINEFENFKDWIGSYELYRGRHTGEADRYSGRFKGMIRIGKYPLGINNSGGNGTQQGSTLFQNVPSNDPVHVLVRIYVVKASSLHPQDLNGKADPYVYLTLGRTKINDKENYISKQLNPVFGKCFEVEALFPQESQLCLQVYDWDLVGRDDLIGETKIDLEDRYYSRHRATCGISQIYDTRGYNEWRDPMRPSQILAKLCKEYKLDPPVYSPGQVRIATKTFSPPISSEEKIASVKADTEALALFALRNWECVPKVGCHLVPEHVETRSLFHPDKPGIIQGKLEMWLDMFPMDLIPRPHIDISPRKPKSYELRIIVWNTDDVVLEDDAFLTGEKMSDIYVKGWLKGPEDTQCTDIHYRSLTGEGNFNWRFIFPFEYLEAEEKIVLSRRESLFAWDETELKIPPRLELQVWDADHFSADDFLGSLSLNLTSFPRGAKSSSGCTLEMMTTSGGDPTGDATPTINIFKQNRLKGWWPFVAKNEAGEHILTGKIEAEFQLVSGEEAEKNPVGFGRSEPNPLDVPRRPDSSFVWFLNPLKSMRYILWRNYKWMIVKIIVILLVLLMIALFVYSMPGYMVKKMLNA